MSRWSLQDYKVICSVECYLSSQGLSREDLGHPLESSQFKPPPTLTDAGLGIDCVMKRHNYMLGGNELIEPN